MKSQRLTLLAALCLLCTGATATAFAATEPGYRVIEKDGVKTYCRTRVDTGSHVKKQRTCLTQKELDELKEATQRSMRAISSQRPPPVGN